MTPNTTGLIAQFADRYRRDESQNKQVTHAVVREYYGMCSALAGSTQGAQLFHGDNRTTSQVALEYVLAGELAANQYNAAPEQRFAGRMDMLNALMTMIGVINPIRHNGNVLARNPTSGSSKLSFSRHIVL